MTSRHAMTLALKKAGWACVRKRGEPLWWRDPLGFEPRSLRTEDAFSLLERRTRHGTGKSAGPARTGWRNRP